MPRDYAEAIRWYRLAVAQGNGSAHNNLAFMYAMGLGVEPDLHSPASRTYRRADGAHKCRETSMTEAKIDANDDHPNHQPQFHLRLLTSNSAAQRHGLTGFNCASLIGSALL